MSSNESQSRLTRRALLGHSALAGPRRRRVGVPERAHVMIIVVRTAAAAATDARSRSGCASQRLDHDRLQEPALRQGGTGEGGSQVRSNQMRGRTMLIARQSASAAAA